MAQARGPAPASGLHLEPRRLPFVKAPRSEAVVDSSSGNTRVSAGVIQGRVLARAKQPVLQGEEKRCKIKRVNPAFRSVSTPR